MSDWIFNFQASNQASTDHALAKWKESHSLPWLVACLSKASASTPNLSELLDAAAAIQPASPAFLTVSSTALVSKRNMATQPPHCTPLEPPSPQLPIGISTSALNLFTPSA